MTTSSKFEIPVGPLEDPILCVLQNVFNHPAFRNNQREVIESILQDKDVLAIIPTGGGKSTCYWIPGIISGGVTVVVTPLIALLNDQVSKLKTLNIPVCCVTSSMHPKERESVFHELTKVDTQYKFLYATPEFVLSQQAKTCFEAMIENNTLSRLIIDEAHCVDTWGNSFRPAYGNLSELKAFMKPVCAFTGTATPRTQKQIVEKLGLTTPVIFQASCNRSNLFFKVMKKSEKHPKEDLAEYVKQCHSNQCGIVYCFSTKDTVELAYILKTKGLPAVYYHGQLDHFIKAENAKAWLNGKALIMCATSAFGMGIDKPDVRFVIHINLPRSMEDYFQQAGRAGRDGNNCTCIVMFRFADRNLLMSTITLQKPDEEITYLKSSVNAVVSYCMSTVCRRKLIMAHFGDESETECDGTCDNCSNPVPPLKEYNSEALTVCKCAKEMQILTPSFSIRQLALTFKGSKSKRDVESKGFHTIEHYGAGQAAFKNDADAITFIHHLILRDVLLENERVVNGRRMTPYIVLGHKCAELEKGDLEILINL